MKKISIFIAVVIALLCFSVSGCASSHTVTVYCMGEVVTLKVKHNTVLQPRTYTGRTEMGGAVKRELSAYYTDEACHHLFTEPVTEDITLYARSSRKGYPYIRFDLEERFYYLYLLGWDEEVSATDFVTAVLGSDENPAHFAFFYDAEHTQPFEMDGTNYSKGQPVFFSAYQVYVQRII